MSVSGAVNYKLLFEPRDCEAPLKALHADAKVPVAKIMRHMIRFSLREDNFNVLFPAMSGSASLYQPE